MGPEAAPICLSDEISGGGLVVSRPWNHPRKRRPSQSKGSAIFHAVLPDQSNRQAVGSDAGLPFCKVMQCEKCILNNVKAGDEQAIWPQLNTFQHGHKLHLIPGQKRIIIGRPDFSRLDHVSTPGRDQPAQIRIRSKAIQGWSTD